jgi:hypothetical protein
VFLIPGGQFTLLIDFQNVSIIASQEVGRKLETSVIDFSTKVTRARNGLGKADRLTLGLYHDVHHFTTRKPPITRASIPELKNVQIASVGVHTIASPRKLNEVFSSTGTPVRLPNSSIRCQ